MFSFSFKYLKKKKPLFILTSNVKLNLVRPGASLNCLLPELLDVCYLVLSHFLLLIIPHAFSEAPLETAT